MDAFRGFVQKFGVGGVGGGDGGYGRPSSSSSSTAEILDTHLPLTKSFVSETLPRAPILAVAKSNACKATEAHALVRRVDERIASHATAAAELKEYVSQLSSMSADIDVAAKQAKSIQTQLLELEGMLSSAGSGELIELQAAEDARFEAVAREKRKRLAEVQRAYDEQLEAFQKERVKLLAAQGGTAGKGKGKRRVLPVGRGLEEVAITTDETASGLEDFFGGSDERIGEQNEAVPAESTSDSRRVGKGKQREIKPAERSRPTAAAPAKKKGNHAIMADEDIDEEEEMMAFYGR